MKFSKTFLYGLALSGFIAAPVHAAKVVASIAPIHSLVAGVMEGIDNPTLIVEGSGSPHTYQLKPSDARALEQADAVFWIGEEIETFLHDPLQSLSKSARVIELAKAKGIQLRKYEEEHDGHHSDHKGHDDHEEHAHHDDHKGHEHHEEHAHHDDHKGHEHHEEHAHHEDHKDHDGHDGHEGHNHGEYDMHIWLDPKNAIAMTQSIANTLSEIDPDNARTYQENATKQIKSLNGLTAEVDEILKEVKGQHLITFHDAYGYFENRFGLEVVAHVTLSAERQPSAKQIHQVQDIIKDENVKCVFAEPQFPTRSVNVVMEGTSAKSAIIDPLGSTLDIGPTLYTSLIKNMAISLQNCLKG